MQHDIKLNIAVGVSAESKSWKNKDINWSELLKRLSKPVETTETFKEFIAMSKSDQHKVKDVGGYVGGYLRNGRRLQANVVSRQLLTLDIDFAHINFWDDFLLLFDCAALIHGTHKHSEMSPRYRLVIPLDREVSSDEYCAISRKVAGELDIDLFDNTTFDPSRLMFWPSVPKDVDYYFEHQDGPILCADDILGMYKDWKDTSLWPTSGETLRELTDRTKKQEDPTLKRGVIGAFCRTYSITEAIDTFLSEEYTPATEGRFTYNNGTTAAGLIVYEDKFCFSHHGTDPTSGKLCNAFDLVRAHKFGHLDLGDQDDKKSFKEMEIFALNDEATKRTIGRERLESAAYDFAEPLEEEFNEELAADLAEFLSEELIEEDEEADDKNWMADLEIDSKAGFVSSAGNLNIIFKNDPRLKGFFRYNEFDSRHYVFNTLPWRRISSPEPIRNVDYSGVRNYIETIYKISGAMKIDDALNLEFERNSYHPVREYLSGLTWDGVPRVETLLIDYFGTPDTSYYREAIKTVLIGGVKRIFEPGCKFDSVIVLVGGQGSGKSTFVRKLGVKWFSDTFLTVHGKEALEQINSGVWVMEMAELAGLKKAEVEPIKHFISKQEDTFRPAYGKTTETFKRQCIFIGTTNDENFLRDPTGNRRWLPVDVHKERARKCSIKGLDEHEIGQIWAEAYKMYRRNESTVLSPEAEALAVNEQISHTLIDERTGLIEDFLEMEIPKNWGDLEIAQRRDYFRNDEARGDGPTYIREMVSVAEIWTECLGKPREDMTPYATKDINALMKGFPEWEQVKSLKRFKHYGPQRYFIRKF